MTDADNQAEDTDQDMLQFGAARESRFRRAVKAMDPRMGQVSGLGVTLPPVTFLATRD